MIDENQEIEMTWAGRNFNYYIERRATAIPLALDNG